MTNTAFNPTDGASGNGAKAYQCCLCHALITYSDRIFTFQGASRHLFVNPAGVECDFYTFSSCPGAIAMGEATEAHTWFSGYRWSLALCGSCGNHMGWFYETASALERPASFWGLLAAHLCDG